MAQRQWEVTQVCYCEHAKQQVALEAEVLYPIDHLPDPPRVLSHRCSHGLQCNQMEKVACKWAGTNPDIDPFRQ
ncbi:MAG: hypothetical protein AB1531_12745 [Chloroflexota bacterium]